MRAEEGQERGTEMRSREVSELESPRCLVFLFGAAAALGFRGLDSAGELRKIRGETR